MDKLRFVAFALTYFGGFLGSALLQRIQALVHRWTYRGPGPQPKTVVVVGGSFAGAQLVRRLADTLPSGWQAVLVERRSHFHYAFAFPRFCVLSGLERAAFIPYAAIYRAAPPGSVRVLHDAGVRLDADASTLTLQSGAALAYDVAVVAAGTAQPPPAKLRAAAADRDRDSAVAALQALQQRIRAARTVAVVGGGAVGVELAADIQTFSDKETKQVTLVHARATLLPRFGARLHEHALAVLETIGVRVVLGQRPAIVQSDADADGGPGTLRYADGREEAYDCVLLCTGQTPNADIVQDLPGAVSATGEIAVAPTLQILGADGPRANLFALGDVAATGGPKMARAAFLQCEVVVANVAALARGRPATTRYAPNPIEASLKLTLGKDHGVMYVDPARGGPILVATGGGRADMESKRGWQLLGAKYEE